MTKFKNGDMVRIEHMDFKDGPALLKYFRVGQTCTVYRKCPFYQDRYFLKSENGQEWPFPGDALIAWPTETELLRSRVSELEKGAGMTKFKVGDKVRILSVDFVDNGHVPNVFDVGDICEIYALVGENLPYLVSKPSGASGCFPEGALELVENLNEKKEIPSLDDQSVSNLIKQIKDAPIQFLPPTELEVMNTRISKIEKTLEQILERLPDIPATQNVLKIPAFLEPGLEQFAGFPDEASYVRHMRTALDELYLHMCRHCSESMATIWPSHQGAREVWHQIRTGKPSVFSEMWLNAGLVHLGEAPTTDYQDDLVALAKETLIAYHDGLKLPQEHVKEDPATVHYSIRKKDSGGVESLPVTDIRRGDHVVSKDARRSEDLIVVSAVVDGEATLTYDDGRSRKVSLDVLNRRYRKLT